MVGAEFLPQTSVLPQVDLVITHGGNNTVTESLFFGKPMVLLPIFWDQHDNAQRLDETGFGIRVDTYAHDPADLRAAIARLLDDGALADRLAQTSRRLQSARGTELAATLIERAARPMPLIVTLPLQSGHTIMTLRAPPVRVFGLASPACPGPHKSANFSPVATNRPGSRRSFVAIRLSPITKSDGRRRTASCMMLGIDIDSIDYLERRDPSRGLQARPSHWSRQVTRMDFAARSTFR